MAYEKIIKGQPHIDDGKLAETVRELLSYYHPKRLLLIPPDYTRLYSGAGHLVAMIIDNADKDTVIDVMPALGTHVPMSAEQCEAFFEGRVKHEDLIVHRWREDITRIGEVPSAFVSAVSDGLVNESIDVEISSHIVNGNYDLILSIGQVVPHEVVGMANYSKNIFVGCGGASMINASHMLGAFYGLERIMGRDHSPVRKVFDYAEHHFLAPYPIVYMLTVTENAGGKTAFRGLYVGRERRVFESAVSDSQKYDVIKLDRPIRKAVVYLDPREFHTTWLGNKAVYRTRMAMAEGGELIILAPGVSGFGEDPENDRLIRKYGYVGRLRVLDLVKKSDELKKNLSVAAHLIHGSSDGHFSVTYCTKDLTKEEVEGVGYNWADLDKTLEKYGVNDLHDGFNTVGGEEIYYISNPALGLWMTEEK